LARGAVARSRECDAEGVYSDAVDPNFNTTGKKFLRGYQLTDKNGVATFSTIYPGWYPRRTPHIHYKIRSPASAKSPYEFTGQLYFDEGLSDRVYAQPPYAGRGKRTVSNLTDWIYQRDGGRLTTLAIKSSKEGYEAAFDVAFDHG
jgi:protocatechuate 3,4-dioxygenase beta subunit